MHLGVVCAFHDGLHYCVAICDPSLGPSLAD